MLKSQEDKQFIEHKTSIPVASLPTENVACHEDTLDEEVVNYEPSVKQNMVENGPVTGRGGLSLKRCQKDVKM